MRVAFLQDNGINESLSLTDVAGLLHSKGHECELFIERNERDFLGSVVAFRPDLVVLPLDIWGEKVAGHRRASEPPSFGPDGRLRYFSPPVPGDY